MSVVSRPASIGRRIGPDRKIAAETLARINTSQPLFCMKHEFEIACGVFHLHMKCGPAFTAFNEPTITANNARLLKSSELYCNGPLMELTKAVGWHPEP